MQLRDFSVGLVVSVHLQQLSHPCKWLRPPPFLSVVVLEAASVAGDAAPEVDATVKLAARSFFAVKNWINRWCCCARWKLWELRRLRWTRQQLCESYLAVWLVEATTMSGMEANRCWQFWRW